MCKKHWLNIIFWIIEVVAWIALTAAVFGDMNPDVLIVSAIVFGVGLAGTCVCTIARVLRESKKKQTPSD